MTRVTDIIARFLLKQGVDKVFGVTGGGSIFITDGFACNGVKFVSCHHEQAAADAAGGYARMRGSLGVCSVTTGCGGTNAMTGVLNAWGDSVPLMVISGQAKRGDTVRNSGLPLRQLGVQEADIIAIAQPITKYSVMVNDPRDITYHLEKSAWTATHGRPGPVWIDVPLDVQASPVDEDKLRHFEPQVKDEPVSSPLLAKLSEMLQAAKRPVVVVGQGVRLAGACAEFKNFVGRMNLPVVASRLGIDVLPSDHPLMIGRIGNKGDRAGNLAVQGADLVLAIGSRLSVSSVGYDPAMFAPQSKVVVVDIDPVEHKKHRVKIDLLIEADAKRFLTTVSGWVRYDDPEWLNQCRAWREQYPVCLPEYADTSHGVSPYTFFNWLCWGVTDEKAAFVTDSGTSFFTGSQAIKVRGQQRYITSGAQAEMGFALPAAIGVSLSTSPRTHVYAITGDGSLQMSVHELQTLAHHHLPVKLFVLNNHGYRSISATQELLCGSRYIGVAAGCGLTLPDIGKIASAYGIQFWRIASLAQMDAALPEVLSASGPVVCEVVLPHNHDIAPRSATIMQADGSLKSLPLDQMWPLIDTTSRGARDTTKETVMVET